jgi:AraC-like DNA-binding protein
MAMHDIFYMIEGYWSVLLEKEELRIKPGDIAVLPAAIAHRGLEYCRANTRTIFIHFSMEKLDHKFRTSTKPAKADRDIPPKNPLTVSSLSHDNGNVFNLFQNLARTFHSNSLNREMRCRAILDLLLAELADIYRGEIIKRDLTVGKLLEYMADHPEKFYTITELAAEANLSDRSLTRRFRAETGKAVHQYQMDYKLDRIANLLKARAYVGLKNLALNFGFYDEFHLSSSFKKKFGVSPGRVGKKTDGQFQNIKF